MDRDRRKSAVNSLNETTAGEDDGDIEANGRAGAAGLADAPRRIAPAGPDGAHHLDNREIAGVGCVLTNDAGR